MGVLHPARFVHQRPLSRGKSAVLIRSLLLSSQAIQLYLSLTPPCAKQKKTWRQPNSVSASSYGGQHVTKKTFCSRISRHILVGVRWLRQRGDIGSISTGRHRVAG